MLKEINQVDDETRPIFVTRSHLPPLAELQPMLEEIWRTRILTNAGPFHLQLEAALCEYLGVPFISLAANGTVALQLALMAAGVDGGEVITTPYSFPATTHVIALAGATPVFVDIGDSVFNLDPLKLEAAITEKTRAIMPVHCYGWPCDGGAIARIAERHGIPVIYDAAHAFGVDAAAGSVLNYGRYSTLSFHATKVFNTFEGGAIVSATAEDKKRIDRLKNFGIASETEVELSGINGKMSELNAAIGLLQLRHVDGAIAARAAIDARYRAELAGIAGIKVPDESTAVSPNYSYFPILVDEARYGESRDALYERLKTAGIYSRRYFYPLLSNLPLYRDLPGADPQSLPQANAIAESVLCLPIYPELTSEEQDRVIAGVSVR
jgi:dTDP-4-amino-4,6-dideoxygalactose transaminase